MEKNKNHFTCQLNTIFQFLKNYNKKTKKQKTIRGLMKSEEVMKSEGVLITSHMLHMMNL